MPRFTAAALPSRAPGPTTRAPDSRAASAVRGIVGDNDNLELTWVAVAADIVDLGADHRRLLVGRDDDAEAGPLGRLRRCGALPTSCDQGEPAGIRHRRGDDGRQEC